MNKLIPNNLRNLDKWNLSRRKFIKGLALAGIASQIPFISSCFNDDKNSEEILFSSDTSKSAKAIQQILLPDDGFGPDAAGINAFDYFVWALSDKQMDAEDKKFIISGLNWTDELSKKEYSKLFFELDTKEQKLLVIKMTDLDWGGTWLSIMMTFILEAMLSNPLYGGNPNKKSWLWLNHYASNPQPDKSLIYPKIFTTIEPIKS